MRVLWLIALASCYQPATDAPCALRCFMPDRACPGALTCNDDNFCTDGRTCDVPIDAADDDDATDDDAFTLPACTPKTSYPGRTPVAITSTAQNPSYTFDLARTLATYEGDARTVMTMLIDSTTAADWATLIANGTDTYHAPHINPEGDEAYVLINTNQFGVSHRIVDAFSLPAVLTVRDETNVDLALSNTTPSAPTARGLGPRRMVINFGPQIFELEDQGGDIWKSVHRYVPADFGLMTLSQPQLTADGRNMVFLGTTGGTTAIYTATRDSMAVLFTSATMVIDDEVEKHPFLTQDCQVIYYFRATGSTVIRAD